MNRTVAVIQARAGSSRLPGKVLMPIFESVSILAYQCARLRSIEGVDELVVATTDRPGDDAVAALADRMGLRVIRGSEQDVLSRFVKTADMTAADTLVRVTSDSPFRDPGVIAACVADHARLSADYTRPREGTLPKGLRAEVVGANLLRELNADPALPRRWREHVTLAIREQAERFHVVHTDFPPALHRPGYDLSVDTEADLAFVRRVHAELAARDWPADAEHLCRLLDALEPSAASKAAS